MIWNEISKLNDKHKEQLNLYFERLKEINTDRIGQEWCYYTKLLIIGYMQCLYDTEIISYQELEVIDNLADEIYKQKYGGL